MKTQFEPEFRYAELARGLYASYLAVTLGISLAYAYRKYVKGKDPKQLPAYFHTLAETVMEDSRYFREANKLSQN